MFINESWTPYIFKALEWVYDEVSKRYKTKRELMIENQDLKDQIRKISSENEYIRSSEAFIYKAVMTELHSSPKYKIEFSNNQIFFTQPITELDEEAILLLGGKNIESLPNTRKIYQQSKLKDNYEAIVESTNSYNDSNSNDVASFDDLFDKYESLVEDTKKGIY